jgi:hypothetical protein
MSTQMPASGTVPSDAASAYGLSGSQITFFRNLQGVFLLCGRSLSSTNTMGLDRHPLEQVLTRQHMRSAMAIGRN